MSNVGLPLPDDWVAPTLSDSTNDTAGPFVGIYVGGTGDVKVTTSVGSNVTFKAVPVGTTLWGRFVRIWSTGTSATLMLGAKAVP